MRILHRAFAAGIAVAVLTLPTLAFAQEGLSTGNTSWVLTSTALVLFMTLPGLALFYGGLVRSQNVLSVLMQCFAICAVASLLWFAVGYSLAFSGSGAFIGDLSNVFLMGIGRDDVNGTIPALLFVLYQMTFAVITPALIIGGFAERLRFSALLWFSSLWLLVVYVPVVHWVWGGGWLGQMGMLDFAGGTVVHITAGVAALVAALVIGAFRTPRQAENATRDEKVWIIGLGLCFSIVVLAALLAYGLVTGERLMPRAAADVVRVEAEARQWAWRFSYDDRPGHVTENLLHIPAGRPVDVAITSRDVVHSFWVPRLAGKLDAIPGHVNVLRIEADAPGTYRGLTAEYNGEGYSRHTFSVEAHDPAGWAAFTAKETP